MFTKFLTSFMSNIVVTANMCGSFSEPHKFESFICFVAGAVLTKITNISRNLSNYHRISYLSVINRLKIYMRKMLQFKIINTRGRNIKISNEKYL